jgi:histone H3/H4
LSLEQIREKDESYWKNVHKLFFTRATDEQIKNIPLNLMPPDTIKSMIIFSRILPEQLEALTNEQLSVVTSIDLLKDLTYDQIFALLRNNNLSQDLRDSVDKNLKVTVKSLTEDQISDSSKEFITYFFFDFKDSQYGYLTDSQVSELSLKDFQKMNIQHPIQKLINTITDHFTLSQLKTFKNKFLNKEKTLKYFEKLIRLSEYSPQEIKDLTNDGWKEISDNIFIYNGTLKRWNIDQVRAISNERIQSVNADTLNTMILLQNFPPEKVDQLTDGQINSIHLELSDLSKFTKEYKRALLNSQTLPRNIKELIRNSASRKSKSTPVDDPIIINVPSPRRSKTPPQISKNTPSPPKTPNIDENTRTNDQKEYELKRECWEQTDQVVDQPPKSEKEKEDFFKRFLRNPELINKVKIQRLNADYKHVLPEQIKKLEKGIFDFLNRDFIKYHINHFTDEQYKYLKNFHLKSLSHDVVTNIWNKLDDEQKSYLESLHKNRDPQKSRESLSDSVVFDYNYDSPQKITESVRNSVDFDYNHDSPQKSTESVRNSVDSLQERRVRRNRRYELHELDREEEVKTPLPRGKRVDIEIKEIQSKKGLLLHVEPFRRMVRRIKDKVIKFDRNKNKKYSKKRIEYKIEDETWGILQRAFEAYIASILEDAQACCKHRKREIITREDIIVSKYLREHALKKSYI